MTQRRIEAFGRDENSARSRSDESLSGNAGAPNTVTQSIAMTGQGSAIADVLERVRAALPDRPHWLRELDLDILRVTDPTNPACAYGTQDRSGVFTSWEWINGGVAYTRGASFGSLPVPRFTTSLDAAMTLAPEGWDWASGQKPDSGWAYVHNGELRFIGVGTRLNPKYRWHEVSAATPALALCAASLSARAAMEKRNG